jgi:hypothetical protein
MRRFYTLACFVVVLPTPVAAQAVTATTFLARDLALEGSPAMAGLAVTAWSGAVGLRVGGGVDVSSGPGRLLGEPAPAGMQAWTADADLRVDGGRLGLVLGDLEPGAFVGFGIHGVRRDGEAATVAAWSYGADLSLPLARWFSVDGQARYRMPHSDDPTLPAGITAGWELRAGVSIHLGSPSRTPTVWSPRQPGRVTRPPPTSSGPSDGDRLDMAGRTLETGERYIGVAYVWGGAHPSEGFDCSGFVQYVYARNGVTLPRVSRDQARTGRRLPPVRGAWERGDLLFFAGDDGVVDHVAIYAGGGWILHASSSRGEVAYDQLDTRAARWYATHLVGARRVLW